jgi:exodeoxyribonuclease VII small subunit
MDESETPNFDASIAELQRIVSNLESGSIGLEQSLADFERGVKLLRTCYGILENAEQKIEILIGLNEQGEPVTEPFDGSASYDPNSQKVGRRRSGKKPARESAESSPPAEPCDEGGLF